MSCENKCRLCDNLIISTAVTFAADTLTINLPARAYNDNCKYCIVIAQAIPDDTTIIAPVVFTIGDDATTIYPFVNKCCEPILASQVRTRTKYPAIVSTSIASGVFKYVGDCLPSPGGTTAASLPIPVATPPAGA